MDYLIFKVINGLVFRSDLLDFIFIFSAKYLGYFLIASVFLFCLKNLGKYKLLPVYALLAGFFARYGVVEIIRIFFHRDRPFMRDVVSVMIDHAPTSSFPSGHSAFFFAFSTIVYFYNKKAGWLSFVASFLISFSRIASGVHWPSDILAGALIGILIGLVVWFSFNLTKKPRL